MDFPFMLYAAETEGDIPTHRGKIQKAIKMLAATCDPNDIYIQKRVFSMCGLDIEALSDAEISYMEKEIERLKRY